MSGTELEQGPAPQPLPPARPGGPGQPVPAIPAAARGGSRALGPVSARLDRHPVRGRVNGAAPFPRGSHPGPEQLAALGMEELTPIAALMVRQMLFLDPPEHTRLRGLASAAFTPRRVAHLRVHIRQIADDAGRRQVVAGPLRRDRRHRHPAARDRHRRDARGADRGSRAAEGWSADFAEMLGNFQHNPDRAPHVCRASRT